MILSLPVLSDPSTSLLEVGGDIQMLLFAGNICLNTASSVSPLLNHCFLLFVTPLVSKFLVLALDPELFKLLLEYFSSWFVRQVTGLTLKPILLVISGRLI